MLHSTHVVKLCNHFHLAPNILKFALRILLWPLCYLAVCCLISMCSGFSSYVSVIDFYFNSPVAWEQTSYNLYSFEFVMAQNVVYVNVPYELEKNVYFTVVGQSNLCMSVISSWLTMLLNSTMSFLIFCQLDRSISYTGVLKSPIIIVDSSISPWSFIRFSLT